MTDRERSRTAHRRARSTSLAALAVLVGGVLGATLGFQVVDGWSLPASSSSDAAPGPLLRPDGAPHFLRGGLTVDDGLVLSGTTVSDDGLPAVTNLDPDLLRALREAADAAEDDGVELSVTSGWRSPAYQEQLLAEAVAEHGSAEEAARWVATAETSAHVSGDAVDIGGSDAQEWLAEHGDEHGLCRTYDNEPWHFELRPGTVERGCPEPYADPAQDPRLHD